MKSTYINTLTHKCAVWLLLAVLCVGVTGCQKELEPIIAKGEPAYISLSTKALNPGVAGSQINTVRVILINPAANHMIELNEFVDSPANPLIIPVKTGTYDVYAVANEEDDGSENTALSNVYNLSTLRAISLPFLATNRDFTNVSMFGVVKSVTINAPASGESSPTNLANVSIGGVDHGTILPVELERMASKVSVKIISKYESVSGVAIFMPSIISLFEDVLLPTTAQVKSIDGGSFILTKSTVDQTKHILECKDILIPSKMFADPTDKSQAMQIMFSFLTGNENIYITELGHLISGATKDYTIKRNHNYEITITVKDKILFTVITIKPWIPKDEDFDVL